MIQSEKMQALKPQVEAAQQKLKAATTREEQMAAQAEMQQVYRENGLSMTGGIGCLPLLIQMPIFLPCTLRHVIQKVSGNHLSTASI